jgi:hypothetical protein
MRSCGAALMAVLLFGCSDESPTVVQHLDADRYPAALSAWGMVTARHETLVLGADVSPYDLNTPLFNDNAHKLRTVWMPPDSVAPYHDSGVSICRPARSCRRRFVSRAQRA